MSDPLPLWSPHGVSRATMPELDGMARRRALLWLLVFGAVPPQHVLPGLEADEDASVGLSRNAWRRFDPGAPVPADIRSIGTSLLDTELTRRVGRKSPLVLFSGGVDSSLMAARLRALGHDDITLLHYSFGEDDPETFAAHAVARQLGLELTVVRRSDDAVGACLAAPGRIYPQPFGDQSAPPTGELCVAVSRIADPERVVVLDGTGADGAFGLGDRAGRAHRSSRLIRAGLPVASTAYARMLWRAGGRAEYAGRVLRRVHRLGPVLATIAQNSLFDVLYEDEGLTRGIAAWESTMDVIGVHDAIRRVILSDLVMTCARIFAQKTYGPLTAAGFEVAYPYLGDELVALGIRHTSVHRTMAPKAWMKEQLTSHVDASLVDRPKSGFIDPRRRLFDTPDFREALREGLSSESVFKGIVRTRPLLRWLGHRDSLARIPVGHQNLLWTVAFTQRWFTTREPEGTLRP